MIEFLKSKLKKKLENGILIISVVEFILRQKTVNDGLLQSIMEYFD